MTGNLFDIAEVYFLPLLVISFLIAYIIIPAIIRVSHEKHLFDEPNDRSSHVQKTPSLGGVAIFAAILITYLLVIPKVSFLSNIHALVPSLVILFFVGLKDDILMIDPYKKLLAQIIASGLFIYFTDIRIGNLFGLFTAYEIPYAPSFVITLFVMIVIINAYNLIDGIDGLAAGIGIIVALSFGMYFYLVKLHWAYTLSLVLTGSLLAFMRFNFSRRQKIFMGDNGSLVVGFILAVLAIKFVQFNEVRHALHVPNAPTIAILILAVPLFDTLRVFTQRIASGSSPFTPDRNHIHHFIIDNGFSHFKATCLLSLSTLLLGAMSFYFFYNASVSYSFVGLIIIFTAYSLVFRREVLVRQPYLKQRMLRKKASKAA